MNQMHIHTYILSIYKIYIYVYDLIVQIYYIKENVRELNFLIEPIIIKAPRIQCSK